MANQFTANNSRYITAPSLGDLTTISSIRVVCRDVVWASDDGYLVSQAGSSNANRTYGLYRISGRLEFWFLGAYTVIGTVSTLFGSTTITANEIDMEVDRVNMTYVLTVDGAVIASGSLTSGSNAGITGMLVRFGARANDNTSGTTGSYLMNAGDFIGDTDIYIDGVLVRQYVMPSGTATVVPDVVGGQDGTLRNPTGDGSDWTVVVNPLSVLFGVATNRIYQRSSSDNRQMVVSGTYAGDTDQVQVRLMSGETEVLTWQNATLDAGSFTTTLTVPSGGPFNFEARALDAGTPLVTQTSSEFYVGEVIGVIGSSSPQRWFTQGSGTLTDSRVQSYRGSYSTVDGAGAVGFANALFNRTGVPILFIERGLSGTTLADWSNSANSNYTTFLTYCAAHDNDIGSVVVLVGYNDAYDGDIVSAASHLTAMNTLVTNIRNDLGSETKVFFVGSQRGIGRNDLQWARLYEAEVSVEDQLNDIYLAATSVDLEIGGDNIHLTDTAYATQGGRAGDFLGAVVEGVVYQLPRVTSAQVVSTTQTDVILSGSGALLPTSGITGFSVSDDNFSTEKSISAAVRVNDTTIRLTHDAVTSPAAVRYQLKANPDISGYATSGGLAVIPSASVNISTPGTTTVSTSADLLWTISNLVFNSTDLQWNNLNTVQVTNDLGWSVQNLSSFALDVDWSVQNTISAQVESQWQVLNTSVSSADLQWQVLNTASSNSELQWQVLNVAGSNYQFDWSTRNNVLTSYEFVWGIEAQPGVVYSGITIAWQTQQLVSQSSSLQWSIRNAINTVLNAEWHVLNRVLSGAEFVWHLQSSVAAVLSSLSLTWGVRSYSVNTVVAEWNVLNSIAADRSLQWSIVNRVAQQALLGWGVRGQVIQTSQIEWEIIGQSRSGVVLRWSINGETVFPDITGTITISSRSGRIQISSLSKNQSIN